MNPKAKAAAAVTAAVAALATPLYLASEGMVLKSYRDPIGIWTACAGHTGPDVQPGQAYTQAQCLEILQRDLAEHNADVVRCVPRPMPPHVHAAALDFTLNVGGEKFCGSTFARKLNAGDWAGACAEISRWVMVGGMDCRKPEHARQCGGIVTRRARERALCEGKPWQAASGASR